MEQTNNPSRPGPSTQTKIHWTSYDLLEAIAKKNRRPMVDELDIAIENHARKLGLTPAPQEGR